MLVQKRKNPLLASVLLLILVAGCQSQVRTIPKIELFRSPEIQFFLKNGTSGNLRILPVQDQSGAAFIDLNPGAHTRLTFRWVTVANLEKTEYSWMKPVTGSETNIIVTNDPVRYIDVQGEDGLIQMRNDQNRLWKLLLDIQSCLEHQNIVDEIIVTGPPDPIIPRPLCE